MFDQYVRIGQYSCQNPNIRTFINQKKYLEIVKKLRYTYQIEKIVGYVFYFFIKLLQLLFF